MTKKPHPPPSPRSPGGKAPSAKAVDWERIELDYRAGIKTLRQIAEEHGISHVAVNKRAKRDGWTRDLAAKIQAKAEELVTKDLVTKTVTTEAKMAERQVIEVAAQAVADVRLAHRRDIRRARNLANALLDELERQTDPGTLAMLGELGELLRNPDEKTGRDRLHELYQAIISLPERSKTMKLLVESLQKLVDMERTAFGMDTKGADDDKKGVEALSTKDLLLLAQALRGGQPFSSPV